MTDAHSSLAIWAWTEHWLVLVHGSLSLLRPLIVQIFQRISTQNSRCRNRKHGFFQQSDPKDVAMHPSASKRTPRDTDSKMNIFCLGKGIARRTDVDIISISKDPRDDSNDNLNAIEQETDF